MSADNLGTVEIWLRFLIFPMERVFDARLDPVRAGKFLFAAPTVGVPEGIDARVGGGFPFTDRRDGEDVEHVGTYLEIDRQRRIILARFGVPKYSSLF